MLTGISTSIAQSCWSPVREGTGTEGSRPGAPTWSLQASASSSTSKSNSVTGTAAQNCAQKHSTAGGELASIPHLQLLHQEASGHSFSLVLSLFYKVGLYLLYHPHRDSYKDQIRQHKESSFQMYRKAVCTDVYRQQGLSKWA